MIIDHLRKKCTAPSLLMIDVYGAAPFYQRTSFTSKAAQQASPRKTGTVTARLKDDRVYDLHQFPHESLVLGNHG